jgi:hypothetical protein
MVQKTIVELRKKLEFLRSSPVARVIGKYNGSTRSFGEATIGRESLIYILNKKNNDTLNEDHEIAFANTCKFDKNWPSWQTGSTAEFISAYETHHKNSIRPRRTNALLARGADIEPEASRIRGLLAVEAFPAQYGRGQVDIGFELSCGELTASHGLQVSIRSGVLEINCSPARLMRSTRKGFDSTWTWTGSQGPVTFTWGMGSTFTGRWRLTAAATSIGNLDVPPEFVTVEHLAPGDEIELSFGFRLKDFTVDDECVPTEGDAKEGPITEDVMVGPPTADGKEIDFRQLSEVKKRILARLKAAALVYDVDGFVVHARHRIGFVEPVTEKDGK